MNIILPLSDELATTSKADVCFLMEYEPQLGICQLCDDRCPERRAWNATEQTVAMTKKSSSTVFPIFSVNCDYQYDPARNALSGADDETIQSYNWKSPGELTADEVWCNPEKCGGCEKLPSNEFCFHNNCWDTLKTHMTAVANASGGEIIDIKDVSTLPDAIMDSIEKTILGFDFDIGTRDLERERFVYEQLIKLPGNKYGKVTIWTYRGVPGPCVEDEPCIANDGCDGTRTCEEGTLSEDCMKNDPTCLGAPCETSELCRVEGTSCLGIKECAEGILSPTCAKIDENCGPDCVHECAIPGEAVCKTAGDTGKEGIFVCAKSKEGCNRYVLMRQCKEPCKDTLHCGEDPVCPIDCSTNGQCNKDCVLESLACDIDMPDCEGKLCPYTDCDRDNNCNPLCAWKRECQVDDPDCTTIGPTGAGYVCMWQPGTYISDDPGCCQEGHYWTYMRYTEFRTAAFYAPVFDGVMSGCCTSADSCIMPDITAKKPSCQPKGSIVELGQAKASYLCGDDRILYQCNIINNVADVKTINGETFKCEGQGVAGAVVQGVWVKQ